MSHRGALEIRRVERRVRRPLPSKGLCDVAPIGSQARVAAFGFFWKYSLVPIGQARARQVPPQRIGDILDQVAIDRDEPVQRSGDSARHTGRRGRPNHSPPNTARGNRERVKQRNQVPRRSRPARPTAAAQRCENASAACRQTGNDDAQPFSRQPWRDIHIGTDVRESRAAARPPGDPPAPPRNRHRGTPASTERKRLEPFCRSDHARPADGLYSRSAALGRRT